MKLERITLRQIRMPLVHFFETSFSRTYSRDILAGIHRYIATHTPWSTFIELRAPDSAPPPWLRKWDGDGIITRTFTQEVADLIHYNSQAATAESPGSR